MFTTPTPGGSGARVLREFPDEAARAAFYEQSWAELVGRNAADDMALAERYATRRRERTPDSRMAIYAAEALLRIRQWAFEHHSRVCDRGLDDGAGAGAAALMQLVEAVDNLRFEIESGAAGGAAGDGGVALVDHALAQTREAAEQEWHDADVADAGETDSVTVACDLDCSEAQQCIELEDSPMRELWNVFCGIMECRHFARTGEYTPLEAQIDACERLAFAPSGPQEQI